jgi:dTDP-glucose pyrophosphorylase
MAGLGTRVKGSFSEPKPFIRVGGHPLYAYGLSSLPLNSVDEILFIVNEADTEFINIEEPGLFAPYIPPEKTWSVMSTPTTRGQASTVAHGTQHMDDSRGLLIASCDTIASGDLPSHLMSLDGALGLFESRNPAMSFARTDGSKVLETAEKRVISSHASSGVYYFSSPGLFMDAFEATHSPGESYIAPLYNSILSNGGTVGFWNHDEVVPLGVTEEIRAYNPDQHKLDLDVMLESWSRRAF